MAEPTLADLKDYPFDYNSSRDVGDVLIGEDKARLIIEASSSGNDTALQSLLSQPESIKLMAETPHSIYHADRPNQGPNDVRSVLAAPTANLDRALIAATENGQAGAVSTLLTFAKQHGLDTSNEATLRKIITVCIKDGHAAVFKAMARADPNVINFPLPHGVRPLYEAVRLREPDLVAVMLELGADPFHPVQPGKQLFTFNSSLMSRAAMAQDPRIMEMLLERGLPIAGSGAMHGAASCSRLDNIRFLIEHGADVNETVDKSGWTPLHFAAWRGRIEAMKLLEDSGARSDLKDAEGKTPAQLLEEYIPPLYQ